MIDPEVGCMGIWSGVFGKSDEKKTNTFMTQGKYYSFEMFCLPPIIVSGYLYFKILIILRYSPLSIKITWHPSDPPSQMQIK